jgi:hypothetical protein
LFVQLGGVPGVPGVILACTGVAIDETSIATDSVTAIAASAANVTLRVYIFPHPYHTTVLNTQCDTII